MNSKSDKSMQVPKGQSGSEQEVQEVGDQVSVSEPDVKPVDGPSAKSVDEPSAKSVDEPSAESVDEPSAGNAVLMVEESIDDVKLQEGPEMKSKPIHDDSKVEVTFDTKELSVPNLQSATNGKSVSSEMEVSNKSESEKSDQEAPAVQAMAHQEQAQVDQTGSDLADKGQGKEKESSDMMVDPPSTVSAVTPGTNDQQQDVTNQQQESEPVQKEEAKELVFDPNKPVGRCSLSLILPVIRTSLFLFISNFHFLCFPSFLKRLHGLKNLFH